MRVIIIYGDKNEISTTKKIIYTNYTSKIISRNIRLIYRLSTKYRIELYGYDNMLKYTIDNPYKFYTLFSIIDKMQMGKLEKSARLLEECGLPISNDTDHCFSDSTHYTCCVLGPKAREYANNSGNPIGYASEKAYRHLGKKVEKTTTWCTCTGSKVCSYYANKFDDGTHIKFIGDLAGSKLDTKDEDMAIDSLKINRHRTQGVN